MAALTVHRYGHPHGPWRGPWDRVETYRAYQCPASGAPTACGLPREGHPFTAMMGIYVHPSQACDACAALAPWDLPERYADAS